MYVAINSSTLQQMKALEAHFPRLRSRHSLHHLPAGGWDWSPQWWHASLLLNGLSFSLLTPSWLFLLSWFLEAFPLEEFLKIHILWLIIMISFEKCDRACFCKFAKKMQDIRHIDGNKMVSMFYCKGINVEHTIISLHSVVCITNVHVVCWLLLFFSIWLVISSIPIQCHHASCIMVTI